MKITLTKEEIKNITPHRDPMLLLDEVALDEDGVAHGTYVVKGDEYFLKGHFPDNPLVPAVIQCEIMAQTAVGLFADNKGAIPVLTGLNNAKFRKPVKPGDIVRTTCKIDKNKRMFYFCSAMLFVNDVKCAEAEFSFAVVSEGQ